MRSCFRCCLPVRNPESVVSDSNRRHTDGDADEMHTALERNSYGSFITCDAPNDTALASPSLDVLLPEVVQKSRENMDLMVDMMVNKAGFVPNGKIADTNLWYINRTSTGLPPIALGELSLAYSDVESLGRILMDLDNKSKWDSEFLTGEVICKYPVSEELVYRKTWAAMKPKSGIAGRDFVYHTLTKTTPDSFCVVSWSADDLDIPTEYKPKTKSQSHVRARIILAGFLVRRISPDKIQINYLNHVDVGISSWLSDPVVKKTPQVLNGLQKYLLGFYFCSIIFFYYQDFPRLISINASNMFIMFFHPW